MSETTLGAAVEMTAESMPDLRTPLRSTPDGHLFSRHMISSVIGGTGRSRPVGVARVEE
jgi:hypothetical protein